MDQAPRLVTVWCPEWPAVAAGVAPEQPAAVFRANRVIACTPAAREMGVRAGTRRRAAQGACPQLLVLDHDPDRDARRFEPVVRAVSEMAPRLEIVEPGWLCLLTRGPSRYFGGDQAMAERLVGLVGDVVGASVGIGVADGRSASAIAARRANRHPSGVLVVPPGGSTDFVDSLSVAWLCELGEITPELVDLFDRLGLRRLGQLAALDAGDVLARFGVEGLHAHRLAGGGDTRPTAATDPPPEWWVEHPFLEAVEQLEEVVFVAKRLADQLVADLAAEGRVCVRLVVIIETEFGDRCERAWYRDQGLSAPAMVERVRWQLEGWAAQPGGLEREPTGELRPIVTGDSCGMKRSEATHPMSPLSGGVALIRLVPDEIRSDDGVQAGLWGGRSQADHDASRAIVRLSGIAGEQAVKVPAWAGGRLPVERYRWVPASAADLEHASDRLDHDGGPWPGALPAPAPTVVPEQPVPTMLLDGAGEQVRVSGRGEVSAAPVSIVVGSVRHRITAWAGPWPIEQTVVVIIAVAPIGAVPGGHRSGCCPSGRCRAAALVDPRHLFVTFTIEPEHRGVRRRRRSSWRAGRPPSRSRRRPGRRRRPRHPGGPRRGDR